MRYYIILFIEKGVENMISQDIINFLKLLYFSAKGEKHPLQINNMNKIMSISTKNRTSVMLYYGIDMLENKIDEENLNKLKNETILYGIKNYTQDLVFKKIADALARENIKLTVFKGYEIKEIYYKSEMRLMGDIDFVVSKKEYLRAREIIFNELGFKLIQEDKDELAAVDDKNVVIELHQHLVTELSKNQKYFDDNYLNNIVSKKNYYILNERFHFLYMIDHMYKHFTEGGLGLKYLYDFILYIEKYPNVIKETQSDLEKLGLNKLTAGLLKICQKYLELNVDEYIKILGVNISDRSIETLLVGILKNGEYGTVESRVNAKTVGGIFVKRIFKRMFPMVIRPQGKIKNKFIHSIKEIIIYPFRLFVYWIKFVFKDHKYIKNVFSNRANLEENHKDDLIFMYKEMK